MGEFFSFKEPVKGSELRFQIIPVSKIIIPSIEREISPAHVKKLAGSIEKVGFLDPILVIETDRGYEVVNGQHRLEAAKMVGAEEVPAIVIPPHIRDYIISLNVEKAPNLRDKAHQAYEIFSYYLERDPRMEEVRLEPMVEEPYYLTVGFVLEELGDERFPGYAFERVLRRVDGFLSLPLEEAGEERRKRAEVLLDLKDVLNRRYEELKLTNAILKEAIVSKAFQSIYGKRVKKVEDDFFSVISKLKEEIPGVELTREDTLSL